MEFYKHPWDKWVGINGLNFHYLDWGGTSDRPLVWLHGMNGNSHHWEFFARNACNDFRIYGLDMRGHGDSDHAKEGYALAKYILDIAEFAKTLGLEKFDLGGMSLGGRNAIGYAGMYPETIKHLILVDIGPEMPKRGSKDLNKRVLSPPLGFRSEEEAMEYYRQRMPRASEEILRHRVEHGLRLNWADKLVFKHDPDLVWSTGSAGKKEIPFVWECLSKITCPVLVLRGAESDLLSPEIAKRMMDVLPNGKYVEIPDSNHYIAEENPAAFEHEVRRFLEK